MMIEDRKICFVSGKIKAFGNNVSHSERKTRRSFDANIQRLSLFSKILGNCTMNITPKGLKTIEAKGGLDGFLKEGKVFGLEGKTLLKRFNLAISKIEDSASAK